MKFNKELKANKLKSRLIDDINESIKDALNQSECSIVFDSMVENIMMSQIAILETMISIEREGYLLHSKSYDDPGNPLI